MGASSGGGQGKPYEREETEPRPGIGEVDKPPHLREHPGQMGEMQVPGTVVVWPS